MKRHIKCRVVVTVFLAIAIIFSAVPLSATVGTGSTHHQAIIQGFINEIIQVQREVTDISLLALENPPVFAERLAANITRIDNNIISLNRRMTEYLVTVPSVSSENRDVLLITNALNLIKNGLYSLNILTTTRENVLRIVLLDEYFRSRIAANDTLDTVQDLLSQ
jgi:hypothetical protein